MKIKMLKKYVYMTACYGSGWRKSKQYAKQYASANQIPARAAIRLARGYWLDVRSTRHLMRANNTVLSAYPYEDTYHGAYGDSQEHVEGMTLRESRQLIKSATLGDRYGMETAIIQGTSAALLVMDDYGELEVRHLANQLHDDLTDASSYLFY